MLAVIGEAPVSSLDANALNADVESARRTLHDTSRSVQAEGWYFNTESSFPLTPDRDGIIALPPNLISVDIEPLRTAGGRTVDVTVRGDRLYDLANHTFVFDPETRYRATVILLLPFTDIPETAKDYIQTRAARRFQGEAVGSETLGKFTQADEYATRAALMREQIRNGDANFVAAPRNSMFGRNTMLHVLDRRI